MEYLQCSLYIGNTMLYMLGILNNELELTIVTDCNCLNIVFIAQRKNLYTGKMYMLENRAHNLTIVTGCNHFKIVFIAQRKYIIMWWKIK